MSILVALVVSVAGFACRDLTDPDGRRWFQDEPCAAGYVHDPLPLAPYFADVDERTTFPPSADSWASSDGSRTHRWRHGHGYGYGSQRGYGGRGRR